MRRGELRSFLSRQILRETKRSWRDAWKREYQPLRVHPAQSSQVADSYWALGNAMGLLIGLTRRIYVGIAREAGLEFTLESKPDIGLETHESFL